MGELGLGSVQWGQRYGVTHRGEPANAGEVGQILAGAAGAGIRVIDTAPSYGDAERKLGTLSPPATPFRWVTKTAAPAGDEDALLRGVRASREHLGPLYGLLEHFPDTLAGPSGAGRWERLENLRSEGWVERIGVSVYDRNQLDAVLHGGRPQLVQLPLNVLDRRVARDGTLDMLSRMGVEVHARSVFLQGALVADPDALPAPLKPLRGALGAFREVAREHDLTPVEAALGYVLGTAGVQVALCGVQSRSELRALVAARTRAATVDPTWFDGIEMPAPDLVDPRTWPQPPNGGSEPR